MVEAIYKTVKRNGKNCCIVNDELGYSYSKADSKAPETKRILAWRCSKKSRSGCRATIVTEGSWITKRRYQHNHNPV